MNGSRTAGPVALVALLIALSGCKHATPDFIAELIESRPESEIRAVWEYELNGVTVYYVQSECCDMYNDLYDANGNRICSPDGGITGDGDGKCPTFHDSAMRRKLIWGKG